MFGTCAGSRVSAPGGTSTVAGELPVAPCLASRVGTGIPSVARTLAVATT
jgi:hypothetical protein